MKQLGFVVGAFVWSILVFVITLFVTFPSRVVADRIRYEIPNFLGKDYSGEVGSVRPWWVGLSASDIKLYKEQNGVVAGAEPGDPPVTGPQLVAIMNKVSLRVHTWSLFRRAPYVSGSVTLTEGSVDYAIGTAVDQRGDILLADLVLGAEGMPLSDLFPLVPGLTMSGDGAVDLDVDLHAGENGMRDATGKISFGGSNLTLSDIELPMVGALGLDVPISELALGADVVDGVATINSGKFQSEIVTAEVTGTITLRDPIDRSAIDVQIVLSNLGEALTPYASFMSDAKQTDGTFQYSCRGVLSRLSANSCSPGVREKRVSSRPTPGGVPSTAASRPGQPPSPVRDAESDEERERRRDEIRERLRQKREERDAERLGTAPPPVHEDPAEDEDPELTDEEHIEEDEPPDEGDPELDELEER